MGDPADCADCVDLDLLRESARELLAARGEKETIDELAAADWTGLLVDEALGGAGWRPVEATIVAEELGRAQDRSPWCGCAVAAAALATAPNELRGRWLPALLDGTATASLALAGDTVRVANADSVDIIIMLGCNGIRLVEAFDAPSMRPDEELLDVTRPVWRVDVANVGNVPIGDAARAAQLLALARVLVSADSLGALSATFERLVAYLRERVAFGAPIASFQAVQHRLVDLLVFEAKGRAVITKAARAMATDDTSDHAVTLSAVAHAFVAAKVTAAVDECMQLSGGIGFTWEYPLHFELRRVFTNGHLLGTARSSRALVADKAGW